MTSTNFEPVIGNFLLSTMPYMAYCLMIPRRQLPFDEDLLIFIMIWW